MGKPAYYSAQFKHLGPEGRMTVLLVDAYLAKDLMSHPLVTALEVDARQHAKNLRDPLPDLHFIQAGAQAIPLAAAAFDLALMLKSLHHVPLAQLDQALAEVHRVLKPGGLLYVSEPVFAGPLNEVIRLFHDAAAGARPL